MRQKSCETWPGVHVRELRPVFRLLPEADAEVWRPTRQLCNLHHGVKAAGFAPTELHTSCCAPRWLMRLH